MQKSKKSARGEYPRNISISTRILVACVLFVLLVPLALVMTLHLPAVQGYLLQKAVEKLEAKTDLQIQFSSVRWSLWRELRLADLKVKTAGEDVLECRDASLGYHLSWQWPYLHPEAVVLEKPSLRLERDAQGRWQLPGGKGRPPEASRSAGPFPWARFPWPQVRIVSGTISATQDGQVVLSIADVNATISVQEVTGSGGPRFKIDLGPWQGEALVPPWGRWELGGEAEISGETLAVSRLELTVPDVAELRGYGQWQLAPPYDGMVELEVREFSVQAMPSLPKQLSRLEEITGGLCVSRHAGRWFLDHDLKTNLGSLQGTLQVDPGAAEGWLVQLASSFIDLQVPLPGQGADSQLTGQVELILTGREVETAQARFHALLEGSRWGDQAIQRGELTASYQHGMLEIKPSRVQSAVGNFNLSAVGDLRGLWDSGHAGEVTIELQAEQASLAGVFNGSTQRVGGRIGYHGHYEAGGLRKWEGWRGEMKADLVLPRFLTLKAAGNQQRGLLDLEYDLEVSDLQQFAAFFPAVPGKGKVSSRGSVKGKYPELLWEGVITSPALRIGPAEGEQLSVKGKGRLIGREGQRELSLKVQNLNVSSRKLGSLNLDLQQEADVCRFNLKSDGLGTHGGARLSGRLEKLWGPVRTLLVSQGALSWGKQSASVEGRVDVGKDGIRVPSLTVRHENQKAQLAGEILADAGTDLKLTLDGVNLGQWVRTFASEIPISGVVSGQVAVKGRADQPEASLTLQLVQGKLMVPAKEGPAAESSSKADAPGREQVVDRIQLQGSLVRDLLNIQGTLQSPAVQTPLTFNAKVPLHLSLYPPQLTIKTGEELASSAKVSALQAEKVLPYLDFLDRLGGRLDLDVRVGGTLQQPAVVGDGSWQDGSFRVAKWPNLIDHIKVDFQADARQIVINRSSMNLLGGEVQVKGRVGYPRFFEMDFEADGTDLEVKDIYGTKGKVSGHAQLLQTPTATRLTGVLNLSNGEMNLGELESDVARSISVIDGSGKGHTVEVRKDPGPSSSFVQRLEMDLTINLPPAGTWVRGKGLEAEITGALKIEKQPHAGVKLRGGFQTLRGEYKFQDYKLTIVDGEVIFPEGPEPDPQLKIVCQKDIKDAIIKVHVTGPLKQPKLIMSSIPAMNQVDILSYLVFDRPAGDLSSKESFQLQDKAASWMGGQASLLLKQVLGDTLLTPDTIEYRKSSNYSRVTSGSGTRNDATVVAIGKHITPDLYVNFEKGVTGEEGDQVAVEYRFNRHLSVQTQFGGTQQSGIDVFWRYDFGK